MKPTLRINKITTLTNKRLFFLLENRNIIYYPTPSLFSYQISPSNPANICPLYSHHLYWAEDSFFSGVSQE
jgi:hypothetical protein